MSNTLPVTHAQNCHLFILRPIQHLSKISGIHSMRSTSGVKHGFSCLEGVPKVTGIKHQTSLKLSTWEKKGRLLLGGGMWLYLSTWDLRQEDFQEFKFQLGYRVMYKALSNLGYLK